MRKEFELTEEQLQILLDASKPVSYMVVGGIEPSSPRENANRAWKNLGEELGFEYLTVEPVSGKDFHWFTAEVTPKAEGETNEEN